MTHVSILVLMEVTLKDAQSILHPYGEGVSILVLMEVTLKVHVRHAAICRISCFNPCFNGSDSKS